MGFTAGDSWEILQAIAHVLASFFVLAWIPEGNVTYPLYRINASYVVRLIDLAAHRQGAKGETPFFAEVHVALNSLTRKLDDKKRQDGHPHRALSQFSGAEPETQDCLIDSVCVREFKSDLNCLGAKCIAEHSIWGRET